MINEGLVHVYCGDSKGKTTAALGLGLRASGHGMKVYMLQFLKSANCGEHEAVKSLPGFTIENVDRTVKFVFQLTEKEKQELGVRSMACLERAFNKLHDNEAEVLILDEVLGAIECGIIKEELLLELLKDRQGKGEIVLTGRYASPEIVRLADYVSKIEKVKHPYDSGIKARKGIEW